MNTAYLSKLLLAVLFTCCTLLKASYAHGVKLPIKTMSLAAAAAAAQGISSWYGWPVISNKNVKHTVKQSKSFIRTSAPHMFGNMSQFEEYTEHSVKPYTDIGQRSLFTPTIPPFFQDINWKKGKETFQDVIGINDLQLQLHSLAARTTNGEFTWRIPNVSDYMKRAESQNLESIYSPPFYTDATGYKLALRMYLNGDGLGKNSHLSVFLIVMKGEYDPLLQWPMDKVITLTLLDQNPDHTQRKNHTLKFITNLKSSSFQRPVNWTNIASGIPKFIPLYALQHENTGRPQYILDDTMYIRVTVRNRPYLQSNDAKEAPGYDEEDMEIDP